MCSLSSAPILILWPWLGLKFLSNFCGFIFWIPKICLPQQIPTGTTEVKRTTVPFMYNLDDSIEGLDVVDFPGVDDRDESISDLADLLLTLAQIVIFVVDYRYG